MSRVEGKVDEISGTDRLTGRKRAPDAPGACIEGEYGGVAAADIKTFAVTFGLLGGGKPDEKPAFGSAPRKRTPKNAAEESRNKFAPNATKPTTASAPAGLDLPSQIKKVDPMAAAQVLQQMMMQLSMVQSLLNSTQSQSSKKTITNSFTGALAILAKELGFEYVISVMDKCLANNAIKTLSSEYQEIVSDAIAGLISNVSTNGIDNIAIDVRPPVVYGDVIPPKVISYLELPNLAIQNYYIKEDDPFPGYKVWQQSSNYYFTKRSLTDYPYESLEDELRVETEYKLAGELTTYFEFKTLTVSILKTLFDKYLQEVKTKGQEKSMGKNSVSPSSIMSILGVLSSIVNLAQSGHLPLSVLNQGAINESLQKFSQGMAMAKQINGMTGSAFNLPSGLSGLANLGGITSIVGNISNIAGGIPGLDAINSLAGNAASLTNLVGNITNVGAFGNLGALQTNLGTLSNILNNSTLSSLSSIADSMNLNLNQITQLASTTNALQRADVPISSIQQAQSLVSRLL